MKIFKLELNIFRTDRSWILQHLSSEMPHTTGVGAEQLVWLRFCFGMLQSVFMLVGYIRFEPFWGHFWTGFQIGDKASAINLNAHELTEKLANWRRNKKREFEELIFTELWLERIKEIYILHINQIRGPIQNKSNSDC